MKIYLIRHGKTQFNEERRYTGCLDISVSSKGLVELDNLKDELKPFDGLPIYTSSLSRTKQTANILFPNSEILGVLPFLNEMNFGDFEGKNYMELKDLANYTNWIGDIFHCKCPNGESFDEFKDRVVINFKEFVKNINNDTVFVIHGGTIQMIMSQLVNQEIPFFEWKTKNGRGYILEYVNNEIVNYTKI